MVQKAVILDSVPHPVKTAADMGTGQLAVITTPYGGWLTGHVLYRPLFGTSIDNLSTHSWSDKGSEYGKVGVRILEGKVCLQLEA